MDIGEELGLNASLCQQAYGVILLVFKTSSGWTILKNPQGCNYGPTRMQNWVKMCYLDPMWVSRCS